MGKTVVNALGQTCPIPVVLATRALREMAEPGTLEIRVDNEVAVQNLQRLAAGRSLPVRVAQTGPNRYAVELEVSQPAGDAPAAEEIPLRCAPDTGNLLVAVDTAYMGRGDDALGAVLMKGFLYGLRQLPTPPQTLLFYNGGARLTVEGSGSLEDLKAMEAQGAEILTCGTCLNHYGLTERLAVGGVTNMYTIVEKLTQAGRVIKP